MLVKKISYCIFSIFIMLFITSCPEGGGTINEEDDFSLKPIEKIEKPVIKLLSYPFSKINVEVNKQIAEISAIIEPTKATTLYTTIGKKLPAGLRLDPYTGAIKGVPTIPTEEDIYTIVATGIDKYGGVATTKIKLTVLPKELQGLTYPSYLIEGQVFQPIFALTPVIKPPEAQVTYTIQPKLPKGLEFNKDGKGTLTGTPQEVVNNVYTVTATATGSDNYSGTAAAQIDIEIKSNLIPLQKLTYSPIFVKTTIGQPIPVITPILIPSEAKVLYEITPELPYGFEFNKEGKGIIRGTPRRKMSTTYTITATEQKDSLYKGTLYTQIHIESERIPLTKFEYLNSNTDEDGIGHITGLIKQSIPYFYPLIEPSDAAVQFQVYPSLPLGLRMNSIGTIYGTPKNSGSETFTFTIVGKGNYSGVMSTQIKIDISKLSFSFSYKMSVIQMELTYVMSRLYPVLVPADATVVFEMEGKETLPRGITFNEHDGSIGGYALQIGKSGYLTVIARGVGDYGGVRRFSGMRVEVLFLGESTSSSHAIPDGNAGYDGSLLD